VRSTPRRSTWARRPQFIAERVHVSAMTRDILDVERWRAIADSFNQLQAANA